MNTGLYVLHICDIQAVLLSTAFHLYTKGNRNLFMIVPVAVDTVVLLMMGVCAARNM